MPAVEEPSDRDGNEEIYAIRTDGSGLERLTSNVAIDSEPTCRPDGHRIAFASSRSGNGDIYEIDRDGSNPRNLSSHPNQDWSPDYAPDGSAIAFTSHRSGHFEIYELGLETGTARAVAGNGDSPGPGETKRVTTTPDGDSFDPGYLPGLDDDKQDPQDDRGITYSTTTSGSPARTIKTQKHGETTATSIGQGSGPSVQPTVRCELVGSVLGSRPYLWVFGTSGDDDIEVRVHEKSIEVLANGELKQTVSGVDPVSGVGFDQIEEIDLEGAEGNDRLRVTVDEDAKGRWDSSGGSPRIRIVGGPGDDTLHGSIVREILNGGPGNDTLNGGPGRDVLWGGAGDDTLNGGSGRDTLFGGSTVNAKKDAQRTGRNQLDTLNGGPGDDTLYGGGGDNHLNGGRGNDTMYSGFGENHHNGGPGNDKAFVKKPGDHWKNVETVKKK